MRSRRAGSIALRTLAGPRLGPFSPTSLIAPADRSGSLRRGRRGSRRAPLPPQELGDGLAGQRAVVEPVLEALLVHAELDGITEGIIDAQLLDEAAVARAAAVGGDDA